MTLRNSSTAFHNDSDEWSNIHRVKFDYISDLLVQKTIN